VRSIRTGPRRSAAPTRRGRLRQGPLHVGRARWTDRVLAAVPAPRTQGASVRCSLGRRQMRKARAKSPGASRRGQLRGAGDDPSVSVPCVFQYRVRSPRPPGSIGPFHTVQCEESLQAACPMGNVLVTTRTSAPPMAATQHVWFRPTSVCTPHGIASSAPNRGAASGLAFSNRSTDDTIEDLASERSYGRVHRVLLEPVSTAKMGRVVREPPPASTWNERTVTASLPPTHANARRGVHTFQVLLCKTVGVLAKERESSRYGGIWSGVAEVSTRRRRDEMGAFARRQHRRQQAIRTHDAL
jgi:hypothetical protein